MDSHGGLRSHVTCSRIVRCINKATQPRRKNSGSSTDSQQRSTAGCSCWASVLEVIDLSSRLTHYQEVRKDTVSIDFQVAVQYKDMAFFD